MHILNKASVAKKVETKGLNEKADKIEKCQNVSDRVKQSEKIILIKKKNIMCLAYQQGKVF